MTRKRKRQGGVRRCDGRPKKVRYSSELNAKIALASTQGRRNSAREECRVYKCPHCFGWHLTSER